MNNAVLNLLTEFGNYLSVNPATTFLGAFGGLIFAASYHKTLSDSLVSHEYASKSVAPTAAALLLAFAPAGGIMLGHITRLPF